MELLSTFLTSYVEILHISDVVRYFLKMHEAISNIQKHEVK